MTKRLANKTPYILLLIVAGIGLLDALYLTYQHYSGAGLICNISHGCEQVLNSKYAVVAGVPVALLGIIFYLTVLLMVVYFLSNPARPKLLFVVGLVGFISTVYLFYLQAFVIRAWCQYCLLSTLTSTVIFIISTLVMLKKNNKEGSDGSEA